MKYILSLDQGTGSSRAIFFDKKAQIESIEQKEIQQIYPNEGWVEQCPKEILESQISVAKKVITDKENNVAAIGITNQRETSILWDKNTGEAIYNAIVWQDQRTKEYCSTLSNHKETIHQKTGLFINPYFSATKIRWILDNVEGAREKAAKGELLFGTVDSWLVWNLTKGALHITDYSNASRTMLFNINTLEWDTDLLKLFDIPENILPKVVPSSYSYGKTHKAIFGRAIPISGIAGDQQASLFGQYCFEKGMIKNTYGTGCFILMNTGSTVRLSNNGLLSTIAWNINGQTTYAQEGSVFMAGAAIKWLRDQLELITDYEETEVLANSIEDNGGVYVVPAFTGLGAPHWNSEVNGLIKGLKLSTKKAHIVRATLESIAYQTVDILKIMEQESNIKMSSLSADGGASQNSFLMQFQADILNINVNLYETKETTALGVAFLAGLSSEFWDFDEIKQTQQVTKNFKPKLKIEDSKKLYDKWKLVVKQLIRNQE